MNPGIYHGMAWDDYRAINLPSPSLQKHGLRSMKRLKRAIDGECQPSSKTVAVGQCVHCIVAGEMDRVAIMPAFEKDEGNVTATGKQSNSKATTYYKEASQKWLEENQGKQILSEVEQATAAKAYRSLQANREAKKLIDRSKLEVTVVGKIEGVLCKTRMDGLVLEELRGWDLKTCPDVEPRRFYQHSKKLGYYFQFAWQRLLLSDLGYELQQYDIIALETQDDYDCGVIEVPFALLDVWGEKVKSVVAQYAMSRRKNDWPGLYPAGKGILQVPNWDMGDDEQVVEWSGELEPISDDEANTYF